MYFEFTDFIHVYLDSEAPYVLKIIIIGIAISALVLLAIYSVVYKSVVLLLKYIDQVQCISYLMYINSKTLYQLDEIFRALSYFHPSNVLPRPFSEQLLSSNSANVLTQTVQVRRNTFDYAGNPKLYGIGQKAPNFIISGGSLLVIYGAMWVILMIVMIVLKIK